ncbi:MAG: hypothetical protein JETT_2806 [Candidatus Jettenia ecosi]|uniref:Uncharacterized protein n=1 Tax=Candidatus Jettenia ecosi TaxID=2494326 RepID=A0A533Q9K2_9BACT|nr:MAG: hypothetical protein JETT_2806 [Candidatus Jettenia ecosi]
MNPGGLSALSKPAPDLLEKDKSVHPYSTIQRENYASRI